MVEKKRSAETTVKNIRRRTRRKYSAEEKIRIVIEGLRGENTVAELCRREGINQNLYYKWSKEFLEAGKQQLAGNTKRQASSNEVKELRRDMEQLKQLVAELALKNRVLKKNLLGMDTTWDKGSQAEKMEIIHLVEHSDLPITRTLDELDVPRSSFYRWYQKYQEDGYDGLADSMPSPRQFWNRIPDMVRDQVVQIALAHPDKSPRQLAWHITDAEGYFISESRRVRTACCPTHLEGL